MEMILERKIHNPNSTEGNLYLQQVDKTWKWFSHTIEDVVRSKFGEAWRKIFKIYAKTAIPYGRYPVLVTWSNKFQRQMVGIFNVPDFEGIRYHWGVNELSSAGCIIGSYKAGNHKLILDKTATEDLIKLVTKAQKTEKVWIEIVDKKEDASKYNT